jgi:hypothetical protein
MVEVKVWRHPDAQGERRCPPGAGAGGDLLFIGTALVGEPVGIIETECGDSIVRFADLDIGIIDRNTRKFRRIMAARPSRHDACPEQTQKTVRDVSGL